MKKALIAVGIVALLAAALGAYLYRTVNHLTARQITDDVYMISGFIGNVAVIRTGDGAVLVDSMAFEMQGEAIKNLAAKLAGEPVRTIINTHYHIDHTHGNPAFDAETRVIATALTAQYLKRCDADYFADGEGFPNELVEGEKDVTIGAKTLRILVPGPGHTGGDLVVYVVEDNVLVAGDLFFNRHYPNIDLEAGGSVQLWPDALDYLSTFHTRHVIPGHGEVSDSAGMAQFRDFIVELGEAALAHADKPLTEASAAIELETDAGYEPIGVPLVFSLDRDFAVRRAWEEASGTVTEGGCPG